MTNNCISDKQELNSILSDINGLNLSEPDGSCVLCRQRTVYKCDRCGDFYCSEICQRKDWQSHRYICFPMPKLVKVNQSNSLVNYTEQRESPQITTKSLKSKTNTSLPPSGSCVILTAFKSSNRCFIRSTNPSIVAEYQKVLNEIHEYGKKASPFTDKPKPNLHALALRGDKWCRVQFLINTRKDNQHRAAYVDYGDICKCNLKDLRRITTALINLPCYVHMVQLKDITKHSIDAKLLNSLLPYTNKEYRVEFVQPDEAGGNVELYSRENNILLNSLILSSCEAFNNDSATSSLSNGHDVQKNGFDKLNGGPNVKNNIDRTHPVQNVESKSKVETNDADSFHGAKPKKMAASPRQIQMQKPCLEPPFEIIPINESDRNCKVLIMDDSYVESGYIGCLLEKYVDNLKVISKFLKEYNVSDQPYKPKFNEYCLASYENEWYRAKVVEILSDDKFLVVYIDFTNEMELTSESIRRYPMSLTSPCYTTLCAIDGLPEDISDELKNFLETNCKAFTSLAIDNVRVIDDIRYVKSNELLKKLHDSKLLKML